MNNKDSRPRLVEDLAGGAVGSVPFFGPLLTPLGSRLASAVAEEWRQNTSKALRAAEQMSGMSREDLAAALEGNPRLIPLLTRVLFQAGMSGEEEKLHALGATLGRAVSTPEAIDEASVLLTALQDLSAAHIRILSMLTTPPPPFDDTPEGTRLAWSGYNIPRRAGLPDGLGPIVLTGLVNAGLISKEETYDFVGEYHPTDLGRMLLDVLAVLKQSG